MPTEALDLRRTRSPRTQAATAAAEAPATEQQPETPAATQEVLKIPMRALLARFTLCQVFDCAWETSAALLREHQEASSGFRTRLSTPGRSSMAAGPSTAMMTAASSGAQLTPDELRELLIAARSLIQEHDTNGRPGAPNDPEVSALESAPSPPSLPPPPRRPDVRPRMGVSLTAPLRAK